MQEIQHFSYVLILGIFAVGALSLSVGGQSARYDPWKLRDRNIMIGPNLSSQAGTNNDHDPPASTQANTATRVKVVDPPTYINYKKEHTF